jgi:hypothetical protein
MSEVPLYESFDLLPSHTHASSGGNCEDPRPHAWSMCAACLCSCISLSRATPLGQSRYQTSGFPTSSEFPTELPSHRNRGHPGCHEPRVPPASISNLCVSVARPTNTSATYTCLKWRVQGTSLIRNTHPLGPP